MKKIILLVFLSLILFSITSAQNLSGNWKGILYQGYSSEFEFSMNLTQVVDSVYGYSEIKSGDKYGKISLTGKVLDSIFTFNEIQILEQSSGVSWCIKYGSLTYNDSTQKLKGPWDAPGCTAGTIEIYRPSIIIDTVGLNESFFPNDTLTVSYKTVTEFDSANTFYVQLSNSVGEFIKPITIGEIVSDTIGKIYCKIPLNISNSCEYKIRIASDKPNRYSETLDFPINSNEDKDLMLEFDGKDDYVEFGNWLNNEDFSISFWMYADSIQNGAAAVIDLQYDLALYSNPTLRSNYVLLHLLQVDIPDDKWVHVTITMDGSSNTRKVYLFGKLVDQNTWNYNPKSSYSLKLGHSSSSVARNYWKGYIDELKIWDYILTDEEVGENVYSKLSGTENGLLGYWDFNQGCTSVVSDLSSNNHEGILLNGTRLSESTIPDIGQRVYPSKAGNTNIVSIKVYGDSFQEGTKVSLISADSTIILCDTSIVSDGKNFIFSEFNLDGVDTGMYSVICKSPDLSTQVIKNSFYIENGTKPDVWVDIISRTKVRNGRPFNLLLNYGNNGNVDARGVIMWIVVPEEAEITPNFPILYPDSFTALNDSIGYYFIDTINNVPSKIMPLFFSKILANSSNTLSITLENLPNKDIQFYAWVNDPLYQSPLKYLFGTCIDQIISTGLGLIPGVGCTYSILDNTFTPLVDAAVTGFSKNQNELSMFHGINSVGGGFSFVGLIHKSMLDMVVGCIPGGKAAKATRISLKYLLKSASNAERYQVANTLFGTPYACSDGFSAKGTLTEFIVKSISSYDPNEIIGPSNFYFSNPNKSDREFNYSIFFENKPTASAAAQEVYIIDTLQQNIFNYSTFKFLSFAYGDTVISIESNTKYTFLHDIDLRPAQNLILRVQGAMDTINNVIKWKYTSLDPLTMKLTDDPELGFLPPNNKSPEGEGFVIYSIKPKKSLKSGVIIQNKAMIVFDLNEPIWTNVWSNIIDKEAPNSSMMNTVDIINDTLVKLNWSGIDKHSAIKSYDLFVSKNNKPFEQVVYEWDSTSIYFKTIPDTLYDIYCIATDYAGNIEKKNELSEVSFVNSASGLEILSASQKNLFTIYPNPSDDMLFFKTAQILDNVKIEICSISGKVLYVENNIQFDKEYSLDISFLKHGIYIIKISSFSGNQITKLIKK